MNAKTRKQIESIISQLETLREQIQEIADDENDKFDNLPESLQYSEKGSALEEAAQNLYDGADEFDEVIAYLEAAIEN